VPLVETLPFYTLADSCSSIGVSWIYMIGKGLLFGLYGRLEEGVGGLQGGHIARGVIGY